MTKEDKNQTFLPTGLFMPTGKPFLVTSVKVHDPDEYKDVPILELKDMDFVPGVYRSSLTLEKGEDSEEPITEELRVKLEKKAFEELSFRGGNVKVEKLEFVPIRPLEIEEEGGDE